MATKGKTIKPDREAQPKKGGKGTPTPGMKGGYAVRGARTATTAKKKAARGR
jgi:hypothetical protein